MPGSIKETALKFALQNAVQHNGKAVEGAVLSRLLAGMPELKARVKEVIPAVRAVVAQVNAMDAAAQRGRLEALAPELLVKEKKERREGLPPLPGAPVEGKVVLRFAPGPSGPLHIGHTRAAILNDEYARMYGGRLILRLEDTDPDRVAPEAYDMIREDLAWLGVESHQVVVQSERFDLYYGVARELLKTGHAYVCTCRADDWRKLKETGRPCPHREEAPEAQLERWDGMLSGRYRQEEAAVVVKTDLNHPNPAIRDYPCLRVCETPHPRTGTRYRVYPLMNFSVAVDDHELGLTHVLRGKDHLNNTYRQGYLFGYMGWKVPEYIHYGRVSIEDTVLKKSLIDDGIRKGEYSGWDDVRLGTVRALAKRGIAPEAVRAYWVATGVKDVDIEFAWENLYAKNGEIVDPLANRYFFVWNPVTVTLFGADSYSARCPLHPSHPERGVRVHEIVAAGGRAEVLVSGDDISVIRDGALLRLKDLANFRAVDGVLNYAGNELAVLKDGVPILHWCPVPGHPCAVQMPDGGWKTGFCEEDALGAVGKVIQFERFGFVRLAGVEEGKLVGYFAHR